MKFKKLDLDESLFDDNWTLADDIFGSDTDNMIPAGISGVNEISEYDDDFSSPDYIPGMPEIDEHSTPAMPGPAHGDDTGVAGMLIDAINDEWSTINTYNGIIATLRDLQGYEGHIAVLQEINAEENRHVGQLQEILKQISPNAEEITNGQIEAKKQSSFVNGRLPVQAWESTTPNSEGNIINEECSLDVDTIDDEM